MVEIVFGEFRVPTTDDAPWQDQVRAFVMGYRDLTRTYSNLVLYLVTDAEAGAKARCQPMKSSTGHWQKRVFRRVWFCTRRISLWII